MQEVSNGRPCAPDRSPYTLNPGSTANGVIICSAHPRGCFLVTWEGWGHLGDMNNNFLGHSLEVWEVLGPADDPEPESLPPPSQPYLPLPAGDAGRRQGALWCRPCLPLTGCAASGSPSLPLGLRPGGEVKGGS